MSKPNIVFVLGRPLEVDYLDELDGDAYGLYYSEEERIEIKDDRNWRTHLLHEVIHAILFISGHSSKMTYKDEEALVMALEQGLKDLYKMRTPPRKKRRYKS